MKLHELHPAEGSRHVRNRVGRGSSSGNGKTSGRGQKGQNSRSGVSIKPWFEGGQTPLYRRVPKRGFNNAKFRKEFAVINVSDLNRFKDGEVITPELLRESGLIKKELNGIKVLGNGTLEKKLTVKANVFTNSAITKIEEMGGITEVI